MKAGLLTFMPTVDEPVTVSHTDMKRREPFSQERITRTPPARSHFLC